MSASCAFRRADSTISSAGATRLLHPIVERLGSSEAMGGRLGGAPRHMLAAAKTDFKMERTVAADQPRGGHLAFGRNRDLRQHRIDQIPLASAQRLALRSAVKQVEGGGGAGFMRSHGAPVSAAWRWRHAPPPTIRPTARNCAFPPSVV